MMQLIRWVGVLSVAFAASVVRADGFIVIHDPPATVPGHFTFAPLEVTYHRVTVDVSDQVATTTVDQEFYNPNGRVLEGTYLFPLPTGSHIDKFAMDVNGKLMDAELLPADKARALYEEIVRKAKDPALLEYVGRDAFKVRIYPIEANGRKHVKITYTQLLKSDTGLTEYVYPLNTEKFSARPLKDVSIKVNLTCAQPLKNVYSPSHTVDVKRDGDRKAVIGFEDRNVRPDTDFKLIFSQDPKEVGIHLLTYRTGGGGGGDGDEGYFMLMASPGNDAKAEAVQPKDVAFVLDTSGSMAGAKLEQAKKALTFCLANLDERDRFEIIRFSTEVEPFFQSLVPATKENVDKAGAFVKGLKPIGATALDEAMKRSLEYAHDKDRPYVVIFLTDGQPTIGETREETIVKHVETTAANVRVFPFGIGTDVNTHLLDRVADQTKAFSQYVLPEEDIEVKVSNFYTKIKEPVLSNVAVAFTGEGVRATQLYPAAMPDLFKGQMLVAFGRYNGTGTGAVKITGTVNGQKKEFAADVKFTDKDTTHAFIPRLWATRRVGWLLDEIRMRGESKELKDEVVRLARAHGIVTPYTAFLIMEDEARRGVPVASRNMRELESDRLTATRAKETYDYAKNEASTPRLRSGDQAVANAQALGGMKSGLNEQQNQQGQESLAKAGAGAAGPVTAARPADSTGLATGGKMAPTQPGFVGYRVAQNYAQQVRVVNGRAFYQNGEVWTDSNIQANQQAKRVEMKFGEEAYFKLLREHPEVAGWMALGNSVDLLVGDEVVSVR